MQWTSTTPEMFDTDAKPVQEALFAAPDKCGTMDMFDAAEEPAPAAALEDQGQAAALVICELVNAPVHYGLHAQLPNCHHPLAQCPQCESFELPGYLERHVARHDRITRNHDERVLDDAAARAAYGPVRPVQR